MDLGRHDEGDRRRPLPAPMREAPGARPPRRQTMEQLRSGEVPGWLRVSASVGWRALVLVALAALAVVAIMRLRVIVVPLVVALLAASVLTPPAAWLMNRRWPPLAAAWLVLIVAGGLLSGLALVLIPVFGDRLSEVGSALASAYGDIRNWLTAGPAGLDRETVDQAEALVVERAQNSPTRSSSASAWH